MTEPTTNGTGAAATGAVEKKDLGTKVKEGAKHAVEKVRKMSDDLVKKIKGKPKEGEAAKTPDVTPTTAPADAPAKTTTSAKLAK